MSTLSTFGVAFPVGVAIIAVGANFGTTQHKPRPMSAASGVVGSCLPAPTHWWPLQRRIRKYVHPISDPADSLTVKYRIATRLPQIDSALVTSITNDSLCEIAAKKYGLYAHGDSLKFNAVTLLRLGDSAYAVGDIESRPGIGDLFLVLTPTWEWRGGSLAPLNWPND